MDFFSAIYLGLILSAFVLFASVLAYAQHATHQARRAREVGATEITAAQRPAEGQRKAA